MSEIKVNKITPRTACGTTTLGDSGDTFTIPSGATIQNLGTATGFGGTGVVSWDTASIKTTGFTAVTGTGYFVNTTGGAISVTLPLSPSAGDVVGVADYAQTWDTYNCTLLRNGSNIGGIAFDSTIPTKGLAITLVYVDATKGWIVTDSGNQTDVPGAEYIAATGGCITTCGNFKMHKFISPGTFCVSAVGNPAGSDSVDYMIVAGGGGTANGGSGASGGGGAGGWRASSGAASGCYTAGPAPLTGPVGASPVTATPYAIVVGGGGSGSPGETAGNVSSFNSVTSAGGGKSAYPGGSGGGGLTNPNPAGSGNDPATTPAQGTDGGDGLNTPSPQNYTSGGGGGAIAPGAVATFPGGAGAGGSGATSCITASPVVYAGGGGGASGREGSGSNVPAAAGGAGGGGAGGARTNGTAGAINTGGGGGGGGYSPPVGTYQGAAGGSGIVVIRYKYQ